MNLCPQGTQFEHLHGNKQMKFLMESQKLSMSPTTLTSATISKLTQASLLCDHSSTFQTFDTWSTYCFRIVTVLTLISIHFCGHYFL